MCLVMALVWVIERPHLHSRNMKLIAAYALLVIGGKEAPTAEEVTAVVTAAGGEVDEAALASLLGDLEGKSIHELLAAGEDKLKSCAGAAVASGMFIFAIYS